MYDLAIIIPSRCEMFTERTVQDIFEHKEANTEVIVVLDGEWADPPITQRPDLQVIYVPESVGQRAATNMGVRLTKAKWVMKADAHCSFAQGFDRVLLDKMEEDWTVVPIMRNLWAFDWKCYHCGWKTYQSPTPDKCGQCGKNDKLRRKIVWIAKDRPQSTSYRFDTEPHFQYFGEYSHRSEYAKMLAETGMTETMSLQGSCWMLSRERYWDLNVCDETLGSWGSQGIEVACKSWLSGGRVLVNHGTYYGHMFRTNGSFSFPYPISGRQTERAKKTVRDLFFNNQWDKQVRSLSWLIEKFAPVPGWTEQDLEKIKNGTH